MARLMNVDLETVEARAVALSLPLFEGLTHVVQVLLARYQGNGPWETIAAFNSEAVAVAYAEGCIASRSRPKYQLYRVMPTMLVPR